MWAVVCYNRTVPGIENMLRDSLQRVTGDHTVREEQETSRLLKSINREVGSEENRPFGSGP